jgi:hypothetical protein
MLTTELKALRRWKSPPSTERSFVMAVDPMSTLKSGPYISLTTFRRTGAAVSTPVWFVQDGGHVLVWTGATSGKAKRIRNSSRVSVAPCTARGQVTGPTWPATARILPAGSERRVEKLLARKYRLMMPVIRSLQALTRLIRRRPRGTAIALRIDFEAAGGAG